MCVNTVNKHIAIVYITIDLLLQRKEKKKKNEIRIKCGYNYNIIITFCDLCCVIFIVYGVYVLILKF